MLRTCLPFTIVAVRDDRMPGGRNSGAVYNLYKVSVHCMADVMSGSSWLAFDHCLGLSMVLCYRVMRYLPFWSHRSQVSLSLVSSSSIWWFHNYVHYLPSSMGSSNMPKPLLSSFYHFAKLFTILSALFVYRILVFYPVFLCRPTYPSHHRISSPQYKSLPMSTSVFKHFPFNFIFGSHSTYLHQHSN